MRAGSLQYRIKVIQSQLTTDEFGAKSEYWVLYHDMRAGILYKSGNKSITDNEMFNSSSVDFSVRYDENITEQMRVVYNNKIYKIAAINRNPFDNSLVISTELIVGLNLNGAPSTLDGGLSSSTIYPDSIDSGLSSSIYNELDYSINGGLSI